MNTEMAYLLGMIAGNGEIHRGDTETSISIEIPHKKLKTEDFHDIALYVKASISDIRNILEPLLGSDLCFIQNKAETIISFVKKNTEYIIREILRYIGSAVSHNNMRVHEDVFCFTNDEKKQFLRGFADVTGYIRRSNYFFDKYMHRVYLEVPHNWEMVIDICNILKDLDIPVQNIDWAHPNMRDGNAIKYNNGNYNFWKKEHQIKIWANEFLPIGFGVIHKQQALEMYSDELISGLKRKNIDVEKKTHIFYWEGALKRKIKPNHPAENDSSLPNEIKGKHFDSWKEIAEEMGYGK